MKNFDSLKIVFRPATLMLYIFFFIPVAYSGVTNSNIQEIYIKLIISDIKRAKDSLAAEEDISLLVSEIHSNVLALNKIDKNIPHELHAINYASFQNKRYVQCPEFKQFHGWDFRRGKNWMNKFWNHSCNCSDDLDHGCQFWLGSFICMGAIPCYPLQFILTPFIPRYYTGNFYKLGFPLDEETDTVKLLQYLNHIQSSLEVMFPELLKDQSPLIEAQLVSSIGDRIKLEQAKERK